MLEKKKASTKRRSLTHTMYDPIQIGRLPCYSMQFNPVLNGTNWLNWKCQTADYHLAPFATKRPKPYKTCEPTSNHTTSPNN